MRLRIDTSGTRFIVTRAPEPRLNFETGAPKVDTATGMPMYATQVLALDDSGGEVLIVTVAGDPKVTVTQPVSVVVWWPSRGPKVIAAGWRSVLMPSPPPPPVVLRRVSRHARRSNNPQAGVGCGEQIIAPRHPDTPGIAVDHTLTEGISHDIEQEEHHQQWIRR